MLLLLAWMLRCLLTQAAGNALPEPRLSPKTPEFLRIVPSRTSEAGYVLRYWSENPLRFKEI
jgi:hypothetical protein